MNILFLAPANNYHTRKWCQFFVSKEYRVSVISFFPGEIENVDVYFLNCSVTAENSDGRKLSYFLKISKIRSIIKKVKPDIISVHYASSYGVIAAFSHLGMYALSIWGGDVYNFPEKSILHRMLIKKSLKSAGVILSTSKAMAEHAKLYTDREMFVTPFGVNMDLFNPSRRENKAGIFIIGTVKALEYKYGIDYLIKAVGMFKKNNPEVKFELRIAGKGSCEEKFKQLCKKEKIAEETKWLGFISQEQAAYEWANMDVAVIPSVLESESFGVSAVEAQACGTAVIVTDIPGLMEATEPGVSSIVVRRSDVLSLEEAIENLYNDNKLRQDLGRNGVSIVKKRFEYNKCFTNIESILLKWVYKK